MITLNDVTKVYSTTSGKRVILDRINLTVEPGEKVGILGRNGAGKSTLIRIIGGTELPTTGSVTRAMSISWPIAFGGAFQGSLTGVDNVRFICRIYGYPIEKAMRFVEEFTDLGEYLREPVRKYSSGMRARLAFAISMAIEFDCFLIDEVVAVGDDRFHEKCHEELFVKRNDRAKIIVSHDPHYIASNCDRCAVLVNGKLIQFDSVGEAFDFYNSTH